MFWANAAKILGSATVVSMAAGALVTGSFAFYKDKKRYLRMQKVYSIGWILAPLAENDCEVTYFGRPKLEERIREILQPKFTNEYYLITGEAGSGKTRTVVEIVRKMIEEEGSKRKGAPIYVRYVQGNNFPQSLAMSVHFDEYVNFDEHGKFCFFLGFILGIYKFPKRHDHNKLLRVLGAIEKSAFTYTKNFNQPIVLVLDGIDSINNHMPGALEKLQEKAKLWADANIAKVIFICNDEETEFLLQKNASNWSRAGAPIAFDDLTEEDSIAFLRVSEFMENSKERKIMPMEEAEKIVGLVGGHIHHLITCKRNWISGKPHEKTVLELRMCEKEKFVDVSRKPELRKAVSKLRDAEKKTMLLSKLIKETSEDAVHSLAKKNILRYRREESGTTVHFQTRLTENVVDDFRRSYDKKGLAKQTATEVGPQ